MNEQLGQLFMLARVGKRWSQERLAMVAGISQASISRIESGEQIDLDSLTKVFYALIGEA